VVSTTGAGWTERFAPGIHVWISDAMHETESLRRVDLIRLTMMIWSLDRRGSDVLDERLT
jgi:hypothetical protein